jgi:LysM domain
LLRFSSFFTYSAVFFAFEHLSGRIKKDLAKVKQAMIKISGIVLLGLGLAILSTAPTLLTPAHAQPAPTEKAAAKADNPLQLAGDAPTMYTVVKGDTLWDISGKFLKEPWRWPEIWNMNRDQIKNPHLIYPGDIVKLSYDASGRPQLSILGSGEGGTVKFSPRVRSKEIGQAIPSIPIGVIGPFLSAPLVIDEGALNTSPRIVASEDSRVIVGAGNVVYGLGITPDKGVRWQIYRPGKVLKNPKTNEILGYEAIYLGDAKITRFGQGNVTPSTLEITKSTQEINRGDRLIPASETTLPQYSPRSPSKDVTGYIVSVLGGVAETAQYSIVVTNLGLRDGIEVGHVLAAQRGGEVVTTNTGEAESRSSWKSLLPASWRRNNADGMPPEVTLPTERNGLMVVFRVFDRVSYALVMSSKGPVKVGDVAQTP